MKMYNFAVIVFSLKDTFLKKNPFEVHQSKLNFNIFFNFQVLREYFKLDLLAHWFDWLHCQHQLKCFAKH